VLGVWVVGGGGGVACGGGVFCGFCYVAFYGMRLRVGTYAETGDIVQCIVLVSRSIIPIPCVRVAGVVACSGSPFAWRCACVCLSLVLSRRR